MENQQTSQQMQPRNILEQILFGQQIINDNVVALADNLNAVHEQLETLLTSLSAIEISEPNTSGAEVINNQ